MPNGNSTIPQQCPLEKQIVEEHVVKSSYFDKDLSSNPPKRWQMGNNKSHSPSIEGKEVEKENDKSNQLGNGNRNRNGEGEGVGEGVGVGVGLGTAVPSKLIGFSSDKNAIKDPFVPKSSTGKLNSIEHSKSVPGSKISPGTNDKENEKEKEQKKVPILK